MPPALSLFHPSSVFLRPCPPARPVPPALSLFVFSSFFLYPCSVLFVLPSSSSARVRPARAARSVSFCLFLVFSLSLLCSFCSAFVFLCPCPPGPYRPLRPFPVSLRPLLWVFSVLSLPLLRLFPPASSPPPVHLLCPFLFLLLLSSLFPFPFSLFPFPLFPLPFSILPLSSPPLFLGSFSLSSSARLRPPPPASAHPCPCRPAHTGLCSRFHPPPASPRATRLGKQQIPSAYSYLWLRPRYSRSANRKRACICSRLFVSLTSSKILRLNKTQTSLVLYSAYSYLCLREKPKAQPDASSYDR